MRLVYWLGFSLPLVLSNASFSDDEERAEKRPEKRNEKELEQAIEAKARAAKEAAREASEHADRERKRAEDLERKVREFKDKMKERGREMKERVERLLKEARGASDRGERERAEKLEREAGVLGEKMSKELVEMADKLKHEALAFGVEKPNVDRQVKVVRALEEKLARGKEKVEALQNKGRHEEAEKVGKEMKELQGRLAEISKQKGFRFDGDSRSSPWELDLKKNPKGPPKLAPPSRLEGAPGLLGPGGGPPREEFERLRGEIRELRGQLDRVQDLLNRLERARAKAPAPERGRQSPPRKRGARSEQDPPGPRGPDRDPPDDPPAPPAPEPRPEGPF